MTVDELRDLVARGMATREDVVMTVARLITPMWPPPESYKRQWPVRWVGGTKFGFEPEWWFVGVPFGVLRPLSGFEVWLP